MKIILFLFTSLVLLQSCKQDSAPVEQKKAVEKITTITKHGKPTNQDVLLLVMQHCNDSLPKVDGCINVGSSPQDQVKSVGEYLSLYWHNHTENIPGNHINITVEDGNNPEIKEIHWKVTFEINGMAEEDPWNWGVRFDLLDKNWEVYKNFFQCIGTG